MKSNAVTHNLARFALLFLLCPLLLLAQNPSASTGVQGVVPPTFNGGTVLPIVGGSLKPAINGTSAKIGVDNFNTTTKNYANNLVTDLLLASPPLPTNSREFAIAGIAGVGSVTGTGLSASPQWTCVPGTGVGGTNNCNIATPLAQMAFIANVSSGSTLKWNAVTTGLGNWLTGIVEFTTNNGQSPILRGGALGLTTNGNTLAGSTVVVTTTCTNTPCRMSGTPPTDSQGNKGILVAGSEVGNCTQPVCGLYMYVFGPTSAAAETVTLNPQAGTSISNSSIVELSGLVPAILNQPATQLQSSNNAFAVTPSNTPAENDTGGIFTESGGFNYQATISVTSTTAIPLWNITQHGVFQSCTVFQRVTGATGTTPTLNTYLQDSPDALGWNDHISMPQATAAGAWEGIAPVFTAPSLAPIAAGAAVVTNTTLAAGSVVAGPMAAYGQIVLVVGGTTPVFTLNLGVTCK